MKRFIPDMSDEELDRLFQEAAENYSPQPGKAAWEDITARLDGKEAAPGRRKPLAWWWQRTFIIMILLGIAYLFYAPPLPRKTGMKGGNVNQKKVIPVRIGTDTVMNTSAGRSPSIPAAGAMKIAGPPVPVPIAGVKKPADQRRGVHLYPHAQANKEDLFSNGRAAGGLSRASAGSGGQVFPLLASKGAGYHMLSATLGTVTADLKPIHPAPTYMFTNMRTTLTQDTPATKMENMPRPKPAPSRWSLRLLAGPDWGTIKFSQWTRPGMDIGLLAGYRFAKRWSAETGILFSNKIYMAPPEYYHPKTPVPWWYDIKSINANCAVVDVPLNLRFDAFSKGGQKIFLTTGFSSFWMKKEIYKYQYTNEYPWSETIRNGSQHIFSVLNFSAGYEKQVSTHFSLQAEPYLKLPLSGIGFGRVKLESTGVFFSLKYNF
ncbi:MAG TPA: hypothetical protein VIU45_00635 [Chitinophagaceae bacterium]